MRENKDKIRAYFDGKLTAGEEQELFLWLKENERNQAIFDLEKQKLNFGGQSNLFVETSLAELKSRIHINSLFSETNKKKTSNHIFKFTRIAAMIIVLLGFGFALSFVVQSDWIWKKEMTWYEVTAPSGDKSQIRLPDGTIVWINAETTIKYPQNFNKGNRNIKLNGEAYFEVAKCDGSTFSVLTSEYGVEVLGTKFNVKAYEADNEVVTTLEEGSIQIVSSDNLKMADNVMLKPNEQIIFNKASKAMTIRKVNSKWYSAWKNNKLIFVNMNMDELVLVLERKYGVDIEVKEKSLLDLHVDGTIKDETIFEILDYLKTTLPVDYHIIDQKIEITNK